MPKCSLFVWLLYQRHMRRNYMNFREGRIFSYSLIWFEVHAPEGACQPMLMKAKARSLTVLCKVAIVVLIVSKAAAQEDFALKRIRRLQLHAPVQSRSLKITLIFLKNQNKFLLQNVCSCHPSLGVFLVKLTLRWESQLGTRLASKLNFKNKLNELLLQRRRPKWPVVPSWVMQHLQNVILQCKGSRCAEHSTFYFEILCWKLSSQSKFWYFQSFSWKVIPPMDSMAWRAKYSGVSCPEGVCCLMRAW